MHQHIASKVSTFCLVLFAVAGLILPLPAGAKSKPPKTNPAPTLTSIVPASIPALSPSTKITLSGANFVKKGFITVNGTRFADKFKSAGRLTAVIPAALLKLPTTLQIVVVNPGPPGGGPSNPQPLIVSKNGAIAVMALPESQGKAGAPWQIFVSTTDVSGGANAGQPVLMHATHGKLSPAKGATDSSGAFVAIYTPSSTKFSSDVISATIGTKASNNLAAVVLSLPTAPPKKKKHHKAGIFDSTAESAAVESASSSLDPSFSIENFAVVGFNGALKQKNSFAIANAAVQTCVNQYMSTGVVSAACAKVFKKPGFAAAATGGITQNEACAPQPAISSNPALASCVANSAGIASIPGVCLGGIQGYQCVVSASVVQGVTPTACAGPIADLEAEISFNSQGVIANNAQFLVQPDLTSPGQSAYACNFNMAPPLPATETPICAHGQTCFYVANANPSGPNDNGSIKVYNSSGGLVADSASNPSIFPGLSEPAAPTYDGVDGLIYVTNHPASGPDTVTAYDLSGTQVTLTSPISIGDANLQAIKYSPVADQLFVGTDLGNNPQQAVQSFATNGAPGPIFYSTNGVPFGLLWHPLTNLTYVTNPATPAQMLAYDAIGDGMALPGNLLGGSSCVDSTGTAVACSSPNNMTFDPATGNLYVTDATLLNNAGTTCSESGMMEFDLNGNNITPSGGFASEASTTAACPDDAFFLNGSLYVANVTGDNIKVFDRKGNDVTTSVASGGFPNLSGPSGIIAVTTP